MGKKLEKELKQLQDDRWRELTAVNNKYMPQINALLVQKNREEQDRTMPNNRLKTNTTNFRKRRENVQQKQNENNRS